MLKVHDYLRKASSDVFAYAVFLSSSIAIFWQFVDKRNFFLGDDFVWLYQAIYGRFIPTLDGFSFSERFGAFSFLYHIVPISPYLDRPVANVAMYFMYSVFGLNSAGFYAVIFVFHLINLALLYEYAKYYISKSASLLAVLLCAFWFSSVSAVYRINALADVVALTFCLLSMHLYKKGISNKSVLFGTLSVLAYFIAMRTKEYAIGLVLIIFFQEIIIDNKSLKNTLKDLRFLMILFFCFFLRYVYLIYETKSGGIVAKGTNYYFHISGDVFFRNTLWYLRELFYKYYVYTAVQCMVLLLVFVAFLNGTKESKKIFIYAFVSFLSLLGPLLFIDGNVSELYLYAPHFFLAFGLAALLERHVRMYRTVLSCFLISSVALYIMIVPYYTKMKFYSMEWYLVQRAANKDQLKQALPLIKAKNNPASLTQSIFVSGVASGINVFTHGWALRVFLDRQETATQSMMVYVLGEHETATEDLFFKKFCTIKENKIHLLFVNGLIQDETSATLKKCAEIASL